MPMPEPTIYEVYELGTRVRIGPVADRIEAWVQSIFFTAGGEHPRYIVTWWNGRTRISTEVEAYELTPIEDPKVKIGFRPAERSFSTVCQKCHKPLDIKHVECGECDESPKPCRPDFTEFRTNCMTCKKMIQPFSVGQNGTAIWRHVDGKYRHPALPPIRFTELQQIEAEMLKRSQRNSETP